MLCSKFVCFFLMLYLKIASLTILTLFQTMFVHPTENQTENEKQFLKRCPPFQCGTLGKVSFPFARASEGSNCGPFPVDNCNEEDQPKMKLSWDSPKWFVLNNISQFQDVNYGNKWSYNITYTDSKRQKHFESRDCQSFNPVTLPVFQFPGSVVLPKLIKIVKCNRSLDQYQFRFECPSFSVHYNYVNESFSPTVPLNCSSVSLPVHPNMGYEAYGDIFKLLTATVSLQVIISVECYLCPLKDGQCQQDATGQWRCLNHFGNEIAVFPQRTNRDGMKITVIATTTAAAILILLSLTLWYLRKRFSLDTFLCWKTRTQEHQNIEDFLRSHGQLTLRRYRYFQVKKMTGMFRQKLGQGGYGAVFKGELPNGTLVAVKLLKDSKSNGKDFINEVASISRTSHVNIVTLLGFCFEGSKRALIYEFISNGSLEKYIIKESSLAPSHILELEKLFDVAFGVAQGLEYLHQGCNTRILHFDIKPHNILLDENFCPKISDFGLAKICTKRESIVSMIEARGTIGYIAPEVFCRNFGGVSHKSDVYSYGMLVLDIVGARKNVRVEVDNGSDMYFPNWIYKSLTESEKLEGFGTDNEVENEIVKKLVMVSLWCIQPMPSNRPTMSRVVEMLQASLESLPIPPRPNISSPSRPLSHLQSMANTSNINNVFLDVVEI